MDSCWLYSLAFAATINAMHAAVQTSGMRPHTDLYPEVHVHRAGRSASSGGLQVVMSCCVLLHCTGTVLLPLSPFLKTQALLEESQPLLSLNLNHLSKGSMSKFSPTGGSLQQELGVGHTSQFLQRITHMGSTNIC